MVSLSLKGMSRGFDVRGFKCDGAGIGDVTAQLVPGLDFFDQRSDDGDPNVATGVVKGAVQVEDLHGDIDGVM